mmetsp:Transcript_47347/g.88685  ORF Transcript_47347/g.88685 Transcript_47347/m.88685 type:complete len:97 (-) Transcript_47347:196-486(-)
MTRFPVVWRRFPSSALHRSVWTVEPPAHVPLNKEIASMRTADAVLALWDQRLSELNTINVATALNRIAKSRATPQVLEDQRLLRGIRQFGGAMDEF